MIVDTGVVVAALDELDPDHGRCAVFPSSDAIRRRVLLPGLCLAEIDYWLHALGLTAQAQQVLDALNRSSWGISWPTDTELAWASDLCSDRPDVGIVDACLLALAESRREPVVASLDHRHLATVELAHGYLELVP